MLKLALLATAAIGFKLNSQQQHECNYPLGLEDGRIPDGDITATDHHVDSSAAHFARLNSDAGAGAWCHSSIDKDDAEQYLQVKLNGLAEVNVIALQRRYNGQESAPLIMVNASLDGLKWHRAGQIDGIAEHEETAHRPITPVNARFIRLVPLTDRKMPVCIRAELFGCYRNDQLRHYKMSQTPTNQGADYNDLKLANGNVADWMTFEPDQLTLDFQWDEPKNLSQVALHLQHPEQLEQVIIQLDDAMAYTFVKVDTCNGTLVYFNLDIFASDVQLRLIYTGQLKMSEIEWRQHIEEASDTCEMAMADHTTTVSHSDELATAIGNDILYVGSISLIALILLLGAIIAVCCSCKRLKKPTQYSQSSLATTNTGTFWNLVPNSSCGTTNHEIRYVQNRADNIIHQYHHHATKPTTQIQSTSSLPSFQPPPPPITPVTSSTHNYPVKYEFGNEYSEIGSITADSGRGDSLNNFNEEKHYAQVTY